MVKNVYHGISDAVGILGDIRLYARIDNIENRYELAKFLKWGTVKTHDIREV